MVVIEQEKTPEGSPSGAVNRQVGGSHYLGKRYQVFDIAFEYNLNPHEFSMLKYLLRDKNRLEDLEKLKHVCELEIERISSTNSQSKPITGRKGPRPGY